MKLAAMHDGKVIGFPDDAEDEHMDAAIHAYHVAGGKAEARQDPGLALLQQGLQTLAAQLEQMQQQVVAVLTAPKRIVHDKDGRPIGVTVGN